MIIDAHTHAHPDPGGMGPGCDATLEALLRAMDRAGVDKAVLSAEAFDVPYVKAVPNAFVAEACAAHSDRLVGFAAVHPAETDAALELRRALETGAFAGIKLHPRFQGVAADDPRAVALAAEAAQWGLPVAVDAMLWKPTPLELQRPLRIDGLCKQVPGARVIMCHAGGFHFMDALAVAVANDQVCLEVSTVLPYFAGTPFEDAFVFVLQQAGARRVIWGSDHPQKDMAADLDAARRIFDKNGFSTEDQRWMLGGTMAALLDPSEGA